MYKMNSREDRMITIFGATGNTGSVVAQELMQAGNRVRLVTRDATKAQHLVTKYPELAQVHTWDWQAVDAFETALEGSHAAYFMTPVGLLEGDLFRFRDEYSRRCATALRTLGTQRVVQLSSFGAHLSEDSGVLGGLQRAEQNLAGCVPEHIILRPGYFWQNFRSNVQGVMQRGFLGGYPIEPETQLYFADTRDVGVHAAGLLTQDSIAEAKTGVAKIYSVVYPQSYSFQQIGQTLGRALNKPELEWVNVGYPAAAEHMAFQSTPKNLIDNFIEFFTCINQGRAGADVKNHPLLECSRGLEDFVTWFTALCYTEGET
jgi:uncharacterized protein YbjT (DUF2867 family)